MSRLFASAIGGHQLVVEDAEWDTETVKEKGEADCLVEVLIVSVRPYARDRSRCSRCSRRCPGYDDGGGLRRWRTLDMGTTKTYLQAPAPRVECAEHGVVVAAVPWARPGTKCTYAMEDTCAWLAANMAFSVLAVFLRLSWRTVAAIVVRVVAERAGKTDLLEGLRRIGIDEISYRKGHRYLTVVVDHDTGRMVWAHEGRNKDTLELFFNKLGTQRCELLTHVSADGADWIHQVVAVKAANAVLCLDPFHVVMWAMKALDKVRTRTIAAQCAQGGETCKRDRNLMWAIRKNPADLSTGQRTTLADLENANAELYRAYLLKEQLRGIFRLKGAEGQVLLDGWIESARNCGIGEFEKLCRSIETYRVLIENTLAHNVTNARTEANNTHLRALTKRAYGYHTPEALIGVAMLTRGGLCPSLPGR